MEVRQIIELPEEVLLQVLSFIDHPSRRAVALTCKHFYSLMCELERDQFALELSWKQITNQAIYESIIYSKRKFRDLTINLVECPRLLTLERLERILNNFGSRLLKFKIWCSIQGDSATITDFQLAKILGWMPELKDLSIKNILVEESSSFKSKAPELNLHKLRKLLLDYCSMPTSILELIPANSINDLVFTFQPHDETCFQHFFNRQKKIRKLEIFENEHLHFDHMELEHIKISSGIDFAAMIRQQPKLRYIDFAITWVDDVVFDEVCKLQQIEVIRTLMDQISCHQFKDLKNIKGLKELRLDTHSPFERGHLHELSMMRLTHLEKLTLVCTDLKIGEEVIIQMGMNFLKLKHIQLINRSIQIITATLQHFPKLETLLIDFFAIFGAPENVLEISNDFRHDCLVELVITNTNRYEDENTRAVLKLVNSCPNLERIMLSNITGFAVEDFQPILENHTKLTHLSLEFESPEFDFDDEMMELVKRRGEHLIHLRFHGLHSVPTDTELEATLGNKFPSCCTYFFKSRTYEIILKKRGAPDWFLNYKLMDHF